MPETVHPDTEGRLEFFALFDQVLTAGWVIEVQQFHGFHVQLHKLGPEAAGRVKFFGATRPYLLAALQAAWAETGEAPAGHTVPSIG
jgi:hypothetical protein